MIHDELFKRRAPEGITLLGTEDGGGKASCQLALRQQLGYKHVVTILIPAHDVGSHRLGAACVESAMRRNRRKKPTRKKLERDSQV